MAKINKKVAFHTLGCKLNFSETSTIARSLDPAQYQRVDFNEEADIYIINTCSVTEAADKKCRQVISKTIRKSPDAYIIIVGCYAQLKPEELISIKGVDLVLGINERFNLHKYIERIEDGGSPEILSCSDDDKTRFESSFSLGDRTRSFLKVQDGCDYKCSYCTIPIARGGSRNQSIEDCVNDAVEIASNGIKEIVITGVNIGDFGKSTNEDFFSLLKELVKVDGINRYRISSIEPNLLTNEIIKLVQQEEKILPHFHIPLQSGNNKILALMQRRYKREVFTERIQKIREYMPRAAIGADVIVGFPGETEGDFDETFEFLKESDINYLHVFSYSSRNNTLAAKFDIQISNSEKHRRSKLLQRLSENKKLEFYRKNIGKSYNVLWEGSVEKGLMSGFTDNYLRVSSEADPELFGTISKVTLKKMDEQGTFTLS